MLEKKTALKLIKEKVDARTSGIIKLQKRIPCKVAEGVFKHTVSTVAEKLFKQGNSVMFIDSESKVRNINVLDATTLRKMCWQILSTSERKNIAYEVCNEMWAV